LLDILPLKPYVYRSFPRVNWPATQVLEPWQASKK
jgi:hypothetical protein